MVETTGGMPQEGMGGQMRESIPDKVLMYACIFTYEKPRVRTDIL